MSEYNATTFSKSFLESMLSILLFRDEFRQMRDAIRPIIPIFEAAYHRFYQNFIRDHNRIDELLELDGFEMRNGHLIQLRTYLTANAQGKKGDDIISLG